MTQAGQTTLEESCLTAVGSEVLASPVYGWGWSNDQPADFRIRVHTLERNADGGLVGGWGTIVEPKHRYDGCVALFTLHYKGVWNFSSSLGHYNLCIYQELPDAWKESVLKFVPSRLPRGYRTCGYAVMGFPVSGQASVDVNKSTLTRTLSVIGFVLTIFAFLQHQYASAVVGLLLTPLPMVPFSKGLSVTPRVRYSSYVFLLAIFLVLWK